MVRNHYKRLMLYQGMKAKSIRESQFTEFPPTNATAPGILDMDSKRVTALEVERFFVPAMWPCSHAQYPRCEKRHPSGADQDLTYYGTLEKPWHRWQGFGTRVKALPSQTKAAKAHPWMWSLGNQTEPVRVPLVSSFFFQVLQVHDHETSGFIQIWTCFVWWFCQLPRGFPWYRGQDIFLPWAWICMGW